MSLISALRNGTAHTYEEAFGAKDITSTEMRSAIADWFELYLQRKPSEEEDPCQQIPYTVVNKLYKTAFSEYTASSDDEFAEKVINALNAKKKKAMQMALVGGEALLKPVPLRDGWHWSVIRRDDLLVFSCDDDGRFTDIGTIERTVSNTLYYTLLERRTVDEYGYLTIRNMLYSSPNEGSVGSPVPLTALPKYAELAPLYTFAKPVGSIGLVSLRTPMENCVDGSNAAVSVYAAAVGLIHNINVNEAQLNGEFKRGESRIITSADLLKKDKSGRRDFRDHVFVGLDDDAENVGVTIFSPTLREQSFHDRKREYLRSVENVIGLKRGLLSEVEATNKTATEVTSSAGDYNLTIIDFQGMWDEAVCEAVRLCGVLGQLYHIPGAHEVPEDKIILDFGDGVLYNREQVGNEMLRQVQMGLLAPERYLGWYYELPCDTPEERSKIRETYMPDSEELSEGDEE